MARGFISKLVGKQKMTAKCEKCGKFFDLVFDDDLILYIPTGQVRIRCPNCQAYHNLSFKIDLVKEKQK